MVDLSHSYVTIYQRVNGAASVKTHVVPLLCSHQNSWVKMDVNNPLKIRYFF